MSDTTIFVYCVRVARYAIYWKILINGNSNIWSVCVCKFCILRFVICFFCCCCFYFLFVVQNHSTNRPILANSLNWAHVISKSLDFWQHNIHFGQHISKVCDCVGVFVCNFYNCFDWLVCFTLFFFVFSWLLCGTFNII